MQRKKIQNKLKDKRESDKQEEKKGTKRRKKKIKKNERMAVGCGFSPTTENTTGNAKSIQINIYINHQELRKAVSDRPSCRNRVNCRVC